MEPAIQSTMVNTITYGLPASYYTTHHQKQDWGNTRFDEPDGDRTVRDTVEISQDGQKIINLTRGVELAAELPDAGADREAFDAALERAQEDIKRITTLFGGVLNLVTELQPRFSEDGQSLAGTAGLDPDIAAQLRQAFNDIRQISAEVDQKLRQRQSEF